MIHGTIKLIDNDIVVLSVPVRATTWFWHAWGYAKKLRWNFLDCRQPKEWFIMRMGPQIRLHPSMKHRVGEKIPLGFYNFDHTDQYVFMWIKIDDKHELVYDMFGDPTMICLTRTTNV